MTLILRLWFVLIAQASCQWLCPYDINSVPVIGIDGRDSLTVIYPYDVNSVLVIGAYSSDFLRFIYPYDMYSLLLTKKMQIYIILLCFLNFF